MPPRAVAPGVGEGTEHVSGLEADFFVQDSPGGSGCLHFEVARSPAPRPQG